MASLIAQGGPFIGDDGAPHGRVTVEPAWLLHTTSAIATDVSSKLPFRWFQNIFGGQTELEVPNIKSIQIDRSLDVDASTCEIVMYNQWMDRNTVAGTPGELGSPGYFSWDYAQGDAAVRWGQVSNQWADVLIPNALLRTYQGYGGRSKTIPQAVTDGNLLLSGVWLIDEVTPTTEGLLTLKCRDMMKLLIEQQVFPPLMPSNWYVLHYYRWVENTFTNPAVPGYDRNDPAPGGVTFGPGYEGRKFIPDSAMSADGKGYWLVGTDGGVFSFGVPFYGSRGDTTDLGPMTTMAADPLGRGYWLGGQDGSIFCQPAGTMVRVPVYKKNQHGTNSSYVKGCRCVECKSSHALYQRNYNQGVSAVESDDGGGTGLDFVDVPIESLKLGDKVVSYNMDSRMLKQKGCKISAINTFAYSGRLVRVSTEDGHSSAYTPEHHCVVRFGDFCKDKHLVYLMRRGNQYRIGRTSMRSLNAGPWARCKDEGGDAFWILSAHDSIKDSGLAEALVAQEFNIPTWRFRKARLSNANSVDVDIFWEKVGDNGSNASKCLSNYGMDVNSPLWDRSHGSFNIRKPFTTRACNLMTGMLVLPVENSVLHSNKSGNHYTLPDQSWRKAVVTEEWYEGDIVSMSVEENHTYVADGIVTHNCFGEVGFYGSALGLTISPISRMAAHPDGRGYWIVSRSGTVWAFGSAAHHGDNPGTGTDIIDICATPTGLGYWLLSAGGAIFTYGDAAYYGGAEDHVVTLDPASGMTARSDGTGYWITTQLGNVKACGATSLFNSNGAFDPTKLNDPITSIVCTPTNLGYLLVGGDGGVFSFGDAPFYGSLPGGFTYTTKTDGDYLDYADIVKDLLRWSGFLAYGNGLDNVYGAIETTGAYAEAEIDPSLFDKKPVIDAINEIKQIVGYYLYCDEEGAVNFVSPNWYQLGNLNESGLRVYVLPEVDERYHLTNYSVTYHDKSTRSEVIVSNYDPVAALDGTVTTRHPMTDAVSVKLLRGMVRPAMWVNDTFLKASEQERMVERIVDHITMSYRMGQVQCTVNPAIQLNDQIRIYERQTGETFVHFVRGIQTSMDLDSGQWLATITSNWLGEDFVV